MIDPHGAEAIATLAAVLFSKEVGFFDVIFEGDALQIVQEINTVLPSYSNCGHFIEGVKQELGSFRSYYVTREARSEFSCPYTGKSSI
jgi:hypothetical protein